MHTGIPPGEIIICHWNEGESTYVQQQLPIPALAGHEQHPQDIWPPLDGATDGQNWTALGQVIWENGCELPETGVDSVIPFLLLFAAAMIAVGLLIRRLG